MDCSLRRFAASVNLLTRADKPAHGQIIVMNVDWTPVKNAFEPVWKQVKSLFGEHHFLTIVCGFFAVMMVISFYRFLKSISPALVGFVLLLILALIVLHWTQTRSEPAFMKPFIDWLAPFFPAPPTPPPKG